MKKLALVTLLAVAASWLLSEDRHNRRQSPELGQANVIYRRPKPPASPEWTTLVRSEKGRPSRAKRASAAAVNPMPSWFPKSEVEEEEKEQPDAQGYRVLIGRLSASEDRARLDLRKTLEREVADWLAADIPSSWKVPSREIDAMMRGAYVQPVTRSFKPTASEPTPSTSASTPEALLGLDDLYTLYRAGQKVDFSTGHRAVIVELYRRDLAAQRMQRLGGGLAVALACLVVLTGYIRTDEATKGYYTNRLRLAAAAGLGVAGVAAYRMLS